MAHRKLERALQARPALPARDHSEHADIDAALNVLKAGLAQGGNEARLANPTER